MNHIKSINLLLLGFVAGAVATYGLYPLLLSMTLPMEKVQQAEKKPLYWVAPMDANYKRDQPGKSPMGMDLIPVYQEDAEDEKGQGLVSISPSVINNLGVKLGKVTQNTMPLKISTVGFIEFNQQTVSHFHSRLEGWIEKLSVNAVGDPVKKGQKLFDLYSPELVNAQEEYIVAIQSNNRRLENASLRKLESLGVESSQIQELKRRQKVQQRLAFYAKQDGYVAMLNVREGSYIKPATNVVSVGSLDSIWVSAEIFERQAGWVESGQRVVMHTDAYASDVWEGELNYVYPVLDAQTRTLRTRIVFDNPDHRLKPNMFTRLSIEAKARENVLSIPREAVIRSAGAARVVKAIGDGKFKSVPIKTGIESDGRIEVLQGLDVGDEVVVSGQFLIDSESSTSAEFSRMEAEETVDAASSADITTVMATGVIESIMEEHMMLTISHGPIKEWDWPSMKMDFYVADKKIFQGLERGQSIRFEISKNDAGDYIVSSIMPNMQETHEMHDMHEGHSLSSDGTQMTMPVDKAGR